MDTTTDSYDLIIIGAGMVGATLACLCAQQNRKVAVIEAYLPEPYSAEAPYDLRVSAISRASQRAFECAGAWQYMLDKRVSPYQAMHVWDGVGDGEIHFDAAGLGEPDLGHIIENKVVQLGLLDAIEANSNISLIPASLKDFRIEDEVVNVELDDGRQLSASLLVGADGANSRVRDLSGLTIEKNDYAQQGLVATIKTEQAHLETAWQRFMPSGPLALLPLADGSCSIVWTLPADKADYYRAMPEQDFNKAISAAFDYRLGAIQLISSRATFPLIGRHAGQYVLPHIALVGDAAHTIHPLAGQGVNLGIKDAVELANVITQCSSNIGSYKHLRRYERARKGDNLITQKSMEAFKVLFGHSLPVVKVTRNLGLNLVNKITPVKNEIIRKAMGI